MKISIIGAGSVVFSMRLIRDLCVTGNLGGITVEFMDINQDRLSMVHELAERYKKEVKADIKFEKTTGRKEALKDCNFVVCTAKVIGYDLMETERKISERYGFYRGLGDRVCDYYGGVGAYYQLKLFLEIAKEMEDVCPEAWFIETANPVFEGTTLVTRETGIKTIGVCHGHFKVSEIFSALNLDPKECRSQAVGFNHCIWMTQFQYKGKNAYPLIDEWIENEAEKYWKSEKYLKCLPWENEQMSPGAVDTYKILGLFPIGDTVRSMSPWWHHTNLETKKRWYGPTGGFDSEIGWSLLLDRLKNNLKKMDELARNPDLPLKREFPAVMSGEQHIPIIDAILNDKETLMQLNVPNEGAVSGIGDDVVVETPVLVSAKGIQRIQVGKLPNRLMQYAINVRMHRMEQLLQAYLEGDRESLVLMNTEDPRAKSYEQTKALLDDLLSQSWNAEAAEHYK